MTSTAASSQTQRELVALLDGKDADGAPLLTDDQLRDVLPLLLLSTGTPAEELTPVEQQLLFDFGVRIGISNDASPDDVAAAIDTHLAKSPLPEGVLLSLQTFAREIVALGDGEGAKAFAAFAGEATSSAIEGPRAPTADQARAGPMARFQLGDKLPTKGKR